MRIVMKMHFRMSKKNHPKDVTKEKGHSSIKYNGVYSYRSPFSVNLINNLNCDNNHDQKVVWRTRKLVTVEPSYSSS